MPEEVLPANRPEHSTGWGLSVATSGDFYLAIDTCTYGALQTVPPLQGLAPYERDSTGSYSLDSVFALSMSCRRRSTLSITVLSRNKWVSTVVRSCGSLLLICACRSRR